MLIALVNSADRNHKTASNLFSAIKTNQIPNICVASSVYLEYELVYRSKGIPATDIAEEIASFLLYPHLGEIPLTSQVIVKAISLRTSLKELTYFDSLHAATAMLGDRQIISNDPVYDEIVELNRLIPADYLTGRGI